MPAAVLPRHTSRGASTDKWRRCHRLERGVGAVVAAMVVTAVAMVIVVVLMAVVPVSLSMGLL